MVGEGIVKSNGDFMPLDSTSEIDTGKPSSVLRPAQIHFLKTVSEKFGDDGEKKLQNIPGCIIIMCW